MDEALDIALEGALGRIALDRPAAINALTHAMVTGIAAQLGVWSGEPEVRAVLVEGRGPKGFCAGGDVRWARQQVLAGQPEAALAFFADEYGMNRAIVEFTKPLVALCDGIVMGGGIGIAGHARFRFATARARFAMPEGAIGFVPDVGINLILAKAPEPRALLFLLAGLPVGAADALALGLTDCVIAVQRMADVRSRIVEAAEASDIERALVGVMQSEGIEPGAAGFCADADALRPELALPTAGEIVAAIAGRAAGEPRFAALAATLASRCPTTLEAIVLAHRSARTVAGGSVAVVFRTDRRLASHMSRRADFAEGVRAVLVDKDQQPRWDPAGFAAVDLAGLRVLFDA